MNTKLAIETLDAAAHQGEPTEFEAHATALRDLLGAELESVELELPTYLEGSLSPLPETGQHLLRAGGKRIRPMLTLLAASIVGHSGPVARKLACAGELVHLATLLHDDVIDDADRRRGEPTPRVVWSNTASVLGGDYALTRALDLVSSAPTTAPLLEAVETLRLLVEGEILQLRFRDRTDLDVDSYYQIVDRKTASLFAWCCRAGAHLGDDPTITEALGTFGHAVGRCFQIIDDIIDFTDGADSGKDPLADLREGKLTLPLLYALEMNPKLAPLLAEPGDHAEQIRHIVVDSGALQRARSAAIGEATRATDALEIIRPCRERDALARIALALAARAR
jgi:octaprenyl-diphosphate synthase